MQKKNNPVPEDVLARERQRLEEERQKLVLQLVKLPNGARFTRFEASLRIR